MSHHAIYWLYTQGHNLFVFFKHKIAKKKLDLEKNIKFGLKTKFNKTYTSTTVWGVEHQSAVLVDPPPHLSQVVRVNI